MQTDVAQVRDKNPYRVSVGKLEEKRLEDIGVHGRTILKINGLRG
jgi:hypothetical protein